MFSIVLLRGVSASAGSEAPPGGDPSRFTAGEYVDAYTEVVYDIDYRSEGGALSRWIKLLYEEGRSIDLSVEQIGDETLDTKDLIRVLVDQAHRGEGGRVFPGRMNRSTTPRLWSAKQAVRRIQDDYNALFLLQSFPAVWSIVTLAALPGGATPRATTKQRGDRMRPPGPPRATSRRGQLAVEGGRELLPSEREGAEYWLEQGRDVFAPRPLGDKGIPGRTGDLVVEGVGKVEIWSPQPTTRASRLVEGILYKSKQAPTVQVELSPDTVVSREELQRLPARTFGYPNGGTQLQRLVIRQGGQLILDAARRMEVK